MINVDLDYINDNFFDIILYDSKLKVSMTEKHIPVYDNNKIVYIERKPGDAYIIDYKYFLNNSNYFIEKYNQVTFKHLRNSDIDEIKKSGFKLINKMKFVDVVKRIDGDFLQLRGKKYESERWNRNHYNKMNFEMLPYCKNYQELYDFIDNWGRKKREHGTQIAVTGYDKNFFKKYVEEWIANDKFYIYFFYHNDKLVAFQCIEYVKDDIYVSLTRKSNWFDYTNVNLYIDFVTFAKIFEERQKPFYVIMGHENNKLTEYKEKRFPTHLVFNYYTCKLDSTKKVFSLF